MVRVFTCSLLVTLSFCLMSSSHAASLVDLKRDVENLETMAENLLNKVNTKDGQINEDVPEEIGVEDPPAGIDETIIDAKSGSSEEIDQDLAFPEEIGVEDPPAGIDETTIDAKSGSSEEIDQDEKSQESDITEQEINEKLGYKDDEEIITDENGKRSAAANVRLWPRINGKLHIPYSISSSFSISERNQIESYIQTMNNNIKCNTNTWKQRTSSDKHYVKFITGGGCSSYVGKTILDGDEFEDGSRTFQPIKLGNGCISPGIVLHEMLHAMGFFHEQSRIDRDNYVKILWENIRSGYERNFRKLKSIHPGSNKTAYDYGSVMHYSKTAFSINRATKNTINVPAGVSIGQRSRLSPLDVEELNNVYGCSSSPTPTTTAPSQTSTTTIKPVTTKPSGPQTTTTTIKPVTTTPSRPQTTTTTIKPVTTTPTSSNSEVFSCGFGTQHCDLNNPNIYAKLSGFKNASTTCRDVHSMCGQLSTMGLCYDRSFGYMIRRGCRKSCRICKPGSHISTPTGYGYIYIRMSKHQDCTQQQIQARTRKRYCLKINYQRTNSNAPKFNVYWYSVYRTSPKYVWNLSSAPNASYRGTLTHNVNMACTGYYSYIYIRSRRQRFHRGELRFDNISLKQGAC